MRYTVCDADEMRKYLAEGDRKGFTFDIRDHDTIAFKPDLNSEELMLHLDLSDKRDELCMRFLSGMKDISKLQP